MEFVTTATTSRAAVPDLRADTLTEAVLRTVLYFDIFGHPLTPEEVFRFLPVRAESVAATAEACRAAARAGLLRVHEEYVMARHVDEPIRAVAERRRKEMNAVRMLRRARIVGRLMRHVPFVRGIYVSGELSKGVSSDQGDVDLLIITAPRRLWIVRTLLIAVKKLFLFNSRRYLCLNHLVTDDALEASPRNIYTALEIGTLLTLRNPGLLSEYARRNDWVSDFLPNLPSPPKEPDGRAAQRTPAQNVLEALLPASWADAADLRLMQLWKRIWARRHPHLSDERRNDLFRCEPTVSTAYAGDFLPRVLQAYDERLRSYGLATDPDR